MVCDFNKAAQGHPFVRQYLSTGGWAYKALKKECTGRKASSTAGVAGVG